MTSLHTPSLHSKLKFIGVINSIMGKLVEYVQAFEPMQQVIYGIATADESRRAEV